jgi:hypothetical protein
MAWPKILKTPLTKKEVDDLAKEFFGDMIKLVIDIEDGSLAAGCSLHADAEQLLLKHGSKQENIWGANYFPYRKKGEKIEYTALINIRPRKGNRSQFIQDEDIRRKVGNIIKGYFEE